MINYILGLEPNYLISLLCFLVFTVLLLITVIFIRIIPRVIKDESVVYDKPIFYTKFLGVLFIVTISFAADNPFVYVIAIIIIATLVTELQFLEMLIALIWNRPEYVKGRMNALNKQQNETETDDRLKQLEKLANETGEKLKTETVQKTQYLLFFHFEKIYRLIFGSQLNILLEAENNNGKIGLQRTVLFYRSSGWVEKGYDVGSYTMFLQNMGLLSYTTDSTPECYYSLTPIGYSFLQYLRENGIPFYKPF